MIVYIFIGLLVLLLIVGLAVANFSTSQLLETFERYNRIPCNKKITGGEYALYLTNNVFASRIMVGRRDGYLNDGYSSKSKMVVLSEATCDVASVAALTVVAHEFGHASQHLTNSKKYNAYKILTKITKVLSYFMFPLAIAGLILCLLVSDYLVLGFSLLGAAFGILLLAVIVKLSLIPIEKDVSNRGIKLLEKTQALDEEEMNQAKDLLKAALLTYIGDFLRSILWWTFLTKKSKLF